MKSKQCNKCSKTKSINNFSVKKDNIDGYNTTCKQCRKEYNIEYSRSIDGIVTRAYAMQKNRHKKHNINKLPYTKEQLKQWLINQKDFQEIYNEWIKSDYNNDKYPSISKIDNTKPYTIDNIKLIEWGNIKGYNGLRPKEIRDRIKLKTKRKQSRAKILKRFVIMKRIHRIRSCTHKVCSICRVSKNKKEFYKSNSCVDKKQMNVKTAIRNNK